MGALRRGRAAGLCVAVDCLVTACESPTGLIRMMVQQSNCFIVVERGIGMQNMMQERARCRSPASCAQGSNMGGGQMVSADFVLTPAVVFSENDSGGIGGALGGLIPGAKGRALGAVAGGLKFKEAQTSMLVTDARSGVQVGFAEGKLEEGGPQPGRGDCSAAARPARSADYTKTNEGKVIAASLGGQLQQRRALGSAVSRACSAMSGTLAEEAAKKTKGGAVYNEGDTIVPKLGNLKVVLVAEQDVEDGRGRLSKGEEMIFMARRKTAT